MEKYLAKIEKMKFTTREYVLIAVCLFLLGIVFGLFFSPKGTKMIGSNNGSNNGSNYGNREEDCQEECEI